MIKCWIFGEMHTPEERDRVEKAIIELRREKKITLLLSEEIGEAEARTEKELLNLLEKEHYSISDRSIRLALDLYLPLVGIDDWNEKTFEHDKKDTEGNYTDCRYSFAVRERRMLYVIQRSLKFNKGGIAVIIGDTHLRTTGNDVVGPPSIITEVLSKRSDVEIIRSPIGEIK